MDAGIATEANLTWLSEHGYRYLVVSRERARQFEAETAIPIETATGATVHIQRVDDPDHKEVRLYCHSEQREEKEQGINRRFCDTLRGRAQEHRRWPQQTAHRETSRQTPPAHRPAQGKKQRCQSAL